MNTIPPGEKTWTESHLAVLQRHDALSPDSPLTLRYLGVTLFSEGHTEKAREIIRRSVALSTDPCEAAVTLVAASRVADYTDASQYLHQAKVEYSRYLDECLALKTDLSLPSERHRLVSATLAIEKGVEGFNRRWQ